MDQQTVSNSSFLEASFGICLQAIVPMRATPNHRSEQVNQLLFGELYQCLQTEGQWLFVRSFFDHYQGWIASNQHAFVSPQYAQAWILSDKHRLHVDCLAQDAYLFIQGAFLPFFDGLSIDLFHKKHTFSTEIATKASICLPKTSASFINMCLSFLGTPYLWGGKSKFGIDCSGFVQLIFSFFGFFLPRDSSQQALVGDAVVFENSQLADLVFFADIDKTQISHVGICLPEQKLVHCSGYVRIDHLRADGLYDLQTSEKKYQMISIKRTQICLE